MSVKAESSKSKQKSTAYDAYEKRRDEIQMKAHKQMSKCVNIYERAVAIQVWGERYYEIAEKLKVGEALVEIELFRLNKIINE